MAKLSKNLSPFKKNSILKLINIMKYTDYFFISLLLFEFYVNSIYLIRMMQYVELDKKKMCPF